MQQFFFLLCLSLLAQFSFGQSTEEDITNRIFMPSLQVGFVHNLSNELSGGFLIQTSIEYQSPNGIFFRLNYDDFDSDYEVSNETGPVEILSGKVSFSDFIGGIGYRRNLKKHNLLIGVQSGLRFYGYPSLNTVENNLKLELKNSNTVINRYTLGYEYELEERVFLVLELFGSHALEIKDYWEDNAWATGFTIGITATVL